MRLRHCLPLAAAFLAGCGGIDTSFLPKTSSAVVDQVEIGPNTWAAYQEYLAAISPAGQGVFAIASDGRSGGSWICKKASCVDNGQFVTNAIERCQSDSGGRRCVVFDIDRVPQIKFTPPE